MLNLDAYREILTSILTEWDQAERDIKQAEQVSLRVSEPSIKELRYAGRRIAEAIHLILLDGDDERIRKLLHDADFDCHRARHDAVDAATSKITSDITAMTNKLGYDIVLRSYPAFPIFYTTLRRIRQKIVHSRKDRQNRDAIYESIENVDLEKIVYDFQDLLLAEAIMKSLARKERLHKFLIYGLGVIEIAVAVVGLITLVLWWFGKL